jgi:hypothetical protein
VKVKVEVTRRHRDGRAWYVPGQVYEEQERVAGEKIGAGLVKRLDGPSENAALSGPSKTAEAEPGWPLSMPPADYIAKYEGQDGLSDAVLERLRLARKIAGSE